MKAKKIIILSIIINILTIGVLYNFIKKDYLNNQKIVVKAMTGTEYEDYITSLNQSHIDYANYIQESKTKIASALTDMGVETSNEETLEIMANNIRSISATSSLEVLQFINRAGESVTFTYVPDYTGNCLIVFFSNSAAGTMTYTTSGIEIVETKQHGGTTQGAAVYIIGKCTKDTTITISIKHSTDYHRKYLGIFKF